MGSITFSNILSQAVAASSTSFATSNVALIGGRLHLLAITSDNDAFDSVTVPTVTQSGATWSLVSAPNGYGPSARRRTFLFRSQPTSNVSSSAITIDHGPMTLRRIIVTISQSSDDVHNDSANNGAACLPQIVVAAGDGGGGTANMSVGLAPFSDTDNATFAIAANVPATTNPDFTPGTGFTALHDLQTGGFDRQAGQYSSDTISPVTATFGAANAWILIAAEIGATAAPGPTVTVWDGTQEVPATIEGVWNGSSIDPAGFEVVT